MDRTALQNFMARHRYGVVSSTAQDGTPRSALVGIAVAPDLAVIFDTVKTSRKYPNLVARPRCSFVIGWDGEQTVQLEGEATEPRRDELRRYRDVYFATWTDGPAHIGLARHRVLRREAPLDPLQRLRRGTARDRRVHRHDALGRAVV
jgi:Pyridoxamine 5'-phosphate oxidase